MGGGVWFNTMVPIFYVLYATVLPPIGDSALCPSPPPCSFEPPSCVSETHNEADGEWWGFRHNKQLFSSGYTKYVTICYRVATRHTVSRHGLVRSNRLLAYRGKLKRGGWNIVYYISGFRHNNHVVLVYSLWHGPARSKRLPGFRNTKETGMV